MDLISLLITILILGLVFWLCIWVIDQLPLPPPFKMVAKAIVGLIIIIALLSMTGLLGGEIWHRPILR